MKLIRFNRAAYAAEFRVLHHQYETYALPLFEKALIKELKKITAQIRRNRNAVLAGVTIDQKVMGAAYLKVYDYVGVAHAEFTYKWIERTAGRKSISFYSDQWRRSMAAYYEQYGALKVAEVERTTIEDIQKLLATGALDNMTQSELATFIADSLDNPAYTRMRAMRISRTESTTAANYGSQLAAEDSDYECGKVWIPVTDSRTRLSHKQMEGVEPIGLYDSFTVGITKGNQAEAVITGTEPMQYPGDPTASAANVVNCRCTHAVVPKADANGLPILKAA